MEVQPGNHLFDTDVVSIEYLTTDPEGITVKTRQTLGRKALAEAYGKPTLTEEQAHVYRDVLRGEAEFQGAEQYKAVRDERGWDSPEAEAAWQSYRQGVQENKKVGIRSPQFDAATNTLTVDVAGVDFPTYKEFAKPGNSAELLAFAEASGNAMVVVTKDNQLVIQHRAVEKPDMLRGGKARGNALYADIPGASAAGMFDAVPSKKSGIPQSINNDSVTTSIMKEVGEELGLGPEHLKDVRIAGVAKDKLQPHDEFLFLARTDMTAAELSETSRSSKRNKDLGDADFEEKFLTIEASSNAIHTLLTNVRCPLPPTHSAAMVAAGYLMVLEQHNLDAANNWRATLEGEMNKNVQEINKTVASYYQRFPEAIQHVPERFWGKRVPERTTHGYSPAYSPEEQGLPSLEDELVRTGLKEESRTQIKRAHLFDIDGVLSDPYNKRVIHNELFDELIKRLRNGEPIALNTGRSADWALNNIVTPIAERLGEDKHVLELLSVIGEKGGSWVTHNKQGEAHHGYATALTLPGEFVQKINHLLTQDPEFHTMLTTQVDPYKKTMVSPEMSAVPEGVNPLDHMARFQNAQKRFAQQAQSLLQETGLTHLFKIDKTAIAIDIESPYAGKDLGADRFLEILKAQGLNFRSGENSADFVTYGDSGSDIAMAEELERRGLSGEFVYVGNDEVKKHPGYTFAVHQVKGFTEGTLGYLQAQ